MKTITFNALRKRIKGRLAPHEQQLKVTRGVRMRAELGEFHTINTYHNCIVEKFVDPEEMGRRLGVLHPWENVRAV